MSKTYTTFSTKKTPQTEPIPGKQMVKNSAGGFVFQIDDWKRLERFLILGTEGGTYYVQERELTHDNAEAVMRCIQEDGKRTVDTIVEISDQGRAVKNAPALFALALCSGIGNEETKAYAYQALPKVARIGTHILLWAKYTQQFQGTGPGWRKAVNRWFMDKSSQGLAYQAIKYQQREGWALSDLLRLAHPKPEDSTTNNIFKWIVDGWEWEEGDSVDIPSIIYGFELAKKTTTVKEIVPLIEKYQLPRECIPTPLLAYKGTWEALLENNALPMMATLRNLGKMTQVELIKPMSKATAKVAEMLTNEEAIRKSRLHPLSILVALATYRSGQGMRGSLTWQPVPAILNALDEAFYLSFGNVEPTNKNLMLSLDVSGSMTSSLSSLPLSCRGASAAMALVTAKVEPNHVINGFYTHGNQRAYGWDQVGVIEDLPISPRQRLEDAVAVVSNLNFGGTDCALPMLHAIDKGYDIDTFVIYTDSETWAGDIHPVQALQQYRKQSGKDTKLIVVGMTSTGFSIADPNDMGMLDVVGFDTSTPQAIAEFSK